MTYRCVAKGGKSFRNTEFFVFEGDRVKRIDVYFGATYRTGVNFVRTGRNRNATVRAGNYLRNNSQ